MDPISDEEIPPLAMTRGNKHFHHGFLLLSWLLQHVLRISKKPSNFMYEVNLRRRLKFDLLQKIQERRSFSPDLSVSIKTIQK